MTARSTCQFAAGAALIKWIFIILGLVCLPVSIARADPPPPEMRAFLDSLEPSFLELSRNPTLSNLGALTGLWVADTGEDNESIELVHIANLGPFLLEYVVDRNTGSLSKPVGYAKKSGRGWAGWFRLGCKGCCPGKSWWDTGTARVDRGDPALSIRVDTVKMDPDTCEMTELPDLVQFRSRLIDTFDFGEFLPGKTIHLIAAPQVGNQPAQYKAAVKLKWDLRGYGISAIDLAANGPDGGSQLLNKSPKLNGERQFVTSRPGTHKFILVAYNAAGQVLHFEIDSIDIPRIPGIN